MPGSSDDQSNKKFTVKTPVKPPIARPEEPSPRTQKGVQLLFHFSGNPPEDNAKPDAAPSDAAPSNAAPSDAAFFTYPRGPAVHFAHRPSTPPPPPEKRPPIPI